MQADIQRKFYETGRVPRGFAATTETDIVIHRERLVDQTVTVTDKIVREGRSVRKEGLPTSSWSLQPISAVRCINVRPSGNIIVTIHDLSRR